MTRLPREEKEDQNQLLKGAKDSEKLATEAQHGLIAQVLKDVIFSMRPQDAALREVSEAVDAPMAIG
ncbi:uncharacterized protein B0H18DRAFT_1118870 [Fomitopsis serialis]|uniref:uncharacterized protein n=1 Tax=Fomitopsis serialis TaxID=139415 RepID=UPI0020078455|nr:uncharacterized protein B0H18DRAFT_1118870 [Neoantrodia serialis]KAH9926816.1 hypothetical protein B0H18DRAFT_1118870 [Neoantrodia serialis]